MSQQRVSGKTLGRTGQSGRYLHKSRGVPGFSCGTRGRQGRPRKERFAPKAFQYRVEDPDAEVHLLVGHDFDRPLASKLSDSLKLDDSDDALSFEAKHAKDVFALISAGLAVGLSPGFRLPPERAVEDAEEIEREPANGEPDGNGDPQKGAIIRTVKAALLYELSIVTKPAYEEATVEARQWSANRRRLPAAWRWR